MPFTVSHAVVALPLRRSTIPASAVAIGAMTPDLPLFVSSAPPYGVTHTLAWLPATTVLAAALWLLWRFVVAPAARDLSPAALAARYPGPTRPAASPSSSATPSPSSPTVRAALVAAGLALGALTHVVWDAFTHAGRWGVQAAPVLTETVAGVPLYSWLQDGSGVLGLTIIAAWFARLPRRDLDADARRAVRWLRRSTIAAVLVATAAGLAVGLATGGPLWRVGYEAVTTAVAWALVVVIVGSLGWHAIRSQGVQATAVSAGSAVDPAAER